MLESMLHVKIRGPVFGSSSMSSLMIASVQSWLNEQNRKKLPNKITTGKKTIVAAAEATLATIPKEVAEVSARTKDEITQQEPVIQVEEVSSMTVHLNPTPTFKLHLLDQET